MYDLKIERGFRPDFLKNKSTGNNLEIDIYLPDFCVGFEYQGAVHFKDLGRYKNDSDKSRTRDLMKYDLLQGYGVKTAIVEIFETDLSGNIKENICDRLLKSQDYFFHQKQFRKCYSLEVVYASFMGIRQSQEARYSKKWFRQVNNLLLSGRFPTKQLIQHLFDLSDKNMFVLPERKIMSIEYVTKCLGVYPTYLSMMESKKKKAA